MRTASPSPPPEQRRSWSSARLVVTTSAGEVLQEYLLDTAVVTIGRVAPADIVLFKDKQVSRRHASVRYEQRHYVLRAECTPNGTCVNGGPLEELVPYVLQDGDQVKIGEHLLVFQAQQSTAWTAQRREVLNEEVSYSVLVIPAQGLELLPMTMLMALS